MNLIEYMWQREDEFRKHWHLFRFAKFIVNMNFIPHTAQETLEYMPATYFTHGKYRLPDGLVPVIFTPKSPPFYAWQRPW